MNQRALDTIVEGPLTLRDGEFREHEYLSATGQCSFLRQNVDMQHLQVLLSTTQVSEAPSTMTTFAPAFIGLVGVIVGGLIQMWFQARQASKENR